MCTIACRNQNGTRVWEVHVCQGLHPLAHTCLVCSCRGWAISLYVATDSVRVKPALHISLFGFFGPILTTFNFSFVQSDCHLVPGGQFIFIPYLYNPPHLSPKTYRASLNYLCDCYSRIVFPEVHALKILISKFMFCWCEEVIRSE